MKLITIICIIMIVQLLLNSNSFADSLSTYTIVIEDGRNLLQQIIVVLTDEHKHSKELKFERQNQYWIAIAHLKEGAKYSYTAQLDGYDISYSFKTGASRSIELFSYTPPEKVKEITITFRDPKDLHENLYLCGTHDRWGNKTDSYAPSKKLTKQNGVFSYSAIFVENQEFVFSIFKTPDVNDSERAGVIHIKVGNSELNYQFICVGNGILQECIYTLLVKDSNNLLSNVAITLISDLETEKEMLFSSEGEYWKAEVMLAEGYTYSYSSHVGNYTVSDSIIPRSRGEIELFDYTPPQSAGCVTLVLDDSVEKRFKTLSVVGNFDCLGNYISGYSKPIIIYSDNYVFKCSMMLAQKKTFTLNLFKVRLQMKRIKWHFCRLFLKKTQKKCISDSLNHLVFLPASSQQKVF